MGVRGQLPGNCLSPRCQVCFTKLGGGGGWQDRGTEQDIESPDQLVIVLNCTPRMNGDKFSENRVLSTEILGGHKPGSHTLVKRCF